MTLTTTITNPAPKTIEDVAHVPHLGADFDQLTQQVEIFSGLSDAEAWFTQFGLLVLKDNAHDVVHNLLSASSSERRNRGLLILERAIVAQAAWLRLFPLMVPAGRFNQLKELVEAVRDADTELAEHNAAKEAVRTTFAEYTARKSTVAAAIERIVDLLDEEAFAFSARADLMDNRPDCNDPQWRVKVLDEVLAGRGEKVHPNALKAVADRLDFLSKRFFGELTTPNGGGGKRRGRSAQKVAKSERDKAERAKRQQPKGQKPQGGRR